MVDQSERNKDIYVPARASAGGVSTRGDGERRVVEPRWRRGRLVLRMVVDPYQRGRARVPEAERVSGQSYQNSIPYASSE